MLLPPCHAVLSRRGVIFDGAFPGCDPDVLVRFKHANRGQPRPEGNSTDHTATTAKREQESSFASLGMTLPAHWCQLYSCLGQLERERRRSAFCLSARCDRKHSIQL